MNSSYPTAKLMAIEVEILALVDKTREAVRRDGQDDNFGLSALLAIQISAHDQEDDYTAIKSTIQQYLQVTEAWRTRLQALLKDVEALEIRRERSERFGQRWWLRRQTLLSNAFGKNPEAGVNQWLQTYTEALLAWELDLCIMLVNESYPFPESFADSRVRMQGGTHAIRTNEYSHAVEMLEFLVHAKADGQSKFALDNTSRGTLLVFIGRIYLYKLSQSQTALTYFEQASALAPEDGRPAAAMGEYYRAQNGHDQALPFFQQAITKSPTQPDGYIGMGLYFEDEKAWEDADEWYQKVVSVVRDEKAPLITLSKLLAPITGNAYLQMARLFQIVDPHLALRALERALEIGINGEGKYIERLAYQLQGEILKDLAQPNDAAEAYYEAGRRFLWRNENATAASLLEQAASLKPDHAPTYWYWMEALRMVSYQQEFPYVNAEAAKALRVWDAGVLIAKQAGQEMDAILGPDFVWAYSSRALLNEQLARRPNTEATTLGWEAVTHLERALLLSSHDAYAWAYLGRFHRGLMNPACALQATQKAVDLDPNNEAALEERATILSNIGNATEAIEMLEQRRQLDANPNVWVDFVKAFNLLLTGPYPEALELLNNALKVAPEDLSYLDLRATCYRMMDDWTHAEEDSKRIWSRYDPSDTYNQNVFAWAAYYLGQPTAARDIFEQSIAVPSEAGYAHRGLGLCALALGQFESAEHHLEQGIAKAANVRELDELLHSDFKTTEHLIKDWQHGAQARAILNRFADKIRSRRRELEQPRSAEAELSDIIVALTQSRAEVNWAWVGAHAGLGRLQGEAERWSEAAAAYQLLLKETKLFPEAGVGLANALDKLQEVGEDRLRAGDPLAALEHLTAALNLTEASKADDIERQAELHSCLGLTHFSLADRTAARSHFLLALQNYRAKGAESPGERLAQACRPLILNPSQYWALRDEWQFWAHMPETQTPDQADLLVARSSLASYLDEAFELKESTTLETFIPIVTPVVLEVGDSLVSKVDSRQDGGKFLYEDIPAMRERFEKTFGVRVPGVRARLYVGSSNANKYHIMLDEASVAIGRVELNRDYCPAAPDKLQSIGVPTAVIVPAINPVTGYPGGWVPRDRWDTVASHSLSIWTETAFIIAHLEAILRRNLTMFLGVQEVETLLAEWEKTEGGAALIPAVLSEPLLRLRFARLLQALVKEQVAIVAWKEILEVVGETGLEDLGQDVLGVRLRLKWLLPGNHHSARRVELPTEWEDKLTSWLRRENGRAFLAAPPEETIQLLSDLRGWLQSRDTNTVIVVRNATLRPLLRRLIESEFPDLMVLAHEELLSEDEMVAGESAPRDL